MAEDVFKNVQVLKGIPVNEFVVGIGGGSLSRAGDVVRGLPYRKRSRLGSLCCRHDPRKRTARRMVLMMAEINRANFGGRQVVTCYTCHRATDRPVVTPNLSTLYADRSFDIPDIIAPAPAAPSVEQVLNKYIRHSAERRGSPPSPA